jgi:hypothetical protein
MTTPPSTGTTSGSGSGYGPDEPDLAEQDMHNLRHCVGAYPTRLKATPGWRNHFCAAEGGQAKSMERLCAAGLMRHGSAEGPWRMYHATEKGLALVIEQGVLNA